MLKHWPAGYLQMNLVEDKAVRTSSIHYFHRNIRWKKIKSLAGETTVKSLCGWNYSATRILVKVREAAIYKDWGFSHLIWIFIIFITFMPVLAAPNPAGKLKFIGKHTHMDMSIIRMLLRRWARLWNQGSLFPIGDTWPMHKLLVGDSTWVHPVPTQCVCTLHLAHYFSSTWNGTDFAFFLVQFYYFEYIDKLEVTQDMGLKLGSSTYKFNNLGESLEQTILHPSTL